MKLVCYSGFMVRKKQEKIGERIKARRMQLGLRQAQLAEMIGFTGKNPGSRVSRWETGDHEPEAMLPKIAAALDCSVDYLLGLTDDPEAHKSPQGSSDAVGGAAGAQDWQNAQDGHGTASGGQFTPSPATPEQRQIARAIRQLAETIGLLSQVVNDPVWCREHQAEISELMRQLQTRRETA